MAESVRMSQSVATRMGEFQIINITPSTSADDARPDLVVVQGWLEDLKRILPSNG